MSAAVHRLRPEEPESKYSPEERARIMSEARVHSVQWKAEQQLRDAPTGPAVSEVKHDYLAEALARPIEDGLTRYQREGREAEERRRAEAERTERKSRREQRQATQNWTSWVENEIERRLAAHVEGQKQSTEMLLKVLAMHNESLEKISKQLAKMEAENVSLRSALALARENFTERLGAFEKDFTKNNSTMAESLRVLGESLAEIRKTEIIQAYLAVANDRRRP